MSHTIKLSFEKHWYKLIIRMIRCSCISTTYPIWLWQNAVKSQLTCYVNVEDHTNLLEKRPMLYVARINQAVNLIRSNYSSDVNVTYNHLIMGKLTNTLVSSTVRSTNSGCACNLYPYTFDVVVRLFIISLSTARHFVSSL
jgi:hypothetical protein